MLQSNFSLHQGLQGVLGLHQSLSQLMNGVFNLPHFCNQPETKGKTRRTELFVFDLILQNISCLYMYQDLFMTVNTNIVFIALIGYLWWGLSLQSSTLGLRVLSSRRVWATLSGFSLSRIAFFKASISISVWKISWRVWMWKQESKRENESWLNKWQSHLFSVSDFSTLLKVKTVQSGTLISNVYRNWQSKALKSEIRLVLLSSGQISHPPTHTAMPGQSTESRNFTSG